MLWDIYIRFIPGVWGQQGDGKRGHRVSHHCTYIYTTPTPYIYSHRFRLCNVSWAFRAHVLSFTKSILNMPWIYARITWKLTGNKQVCDSLGTHYNETWIVGVHIQYKRHKEKSPLQETVYFTLLKDSCTQ